MTDSPLRYIRWAALAVAAAFAGIALVMLVASPSSAQDFPECPADVDGQVLSTAAPVGGDGPFLGLRCRYDPSEGRSAVILVVRWNPPGAEPTFARTCGAEATREEDTDENKLTGQLFGDTALVRVSWEIANTERAFNELAVVAASEGFLQAVAPLAIPCPSVPGGAAECAAQVTGLDIVTGVRTVEEDRTLVRCIYGPTDSASEVRLVAVFNPPETEPTIGATCGADPTQEEADGAITGFRFSALTMSRVRYEIVDTGQSSDLDGVIAAADDLLAAVERQGQLCPGAELPPATLPPATTTPSTAATATTAPATTQPGDTTTTEGATTTDTGGTTAVAAEGGDGDDDSGILLPLAIGSLAVAIGAGAFVIYRRSQSGRGGSDGGGAPPPPPPTPQAPPAPKGPDTIIDGSPPTG